VVLKLGADISEYLEKLAIADAALKKFAADVPNTLKATEAGIAAEGKKAGKAFTEGLADEAEAGVKRIARDAAGRLRDERGRFVAAGEHAGDGFLLAFLRKLASGLRSGLGALGTSLGVLWKGFMATAIPAAVGGAAQLVSALAPAVGAISLIPAAAVGAATALGTLKLALSGVGDAISAGLAGHTAAFNKAMAGLAPAAQQAVRAIVSLKPQLDGLRQVVQRNFFAHFAADIRPLGDQYLPMLTAELGHVSSGLGEMAGQITRLARTPDFFNGVGSTLRNVGDAVRNVTRAVPGVVDGFRRITQVGSQFLPGLTSGFGQLGAKFDAFITRVQNSGQLAKFIQGGLDALKLLGPLLTNVGSILSSVFQAMGSAGGQALGMFGQLIGVLAQFLKSAGGVQMLNGLFSILGQIANALGGAVGQVLPVVGSLLSTVMTALQPIIGLLTGQFLPVVANLVGSLGTALVPVVAALAPALGQVLSALMPVVSVLGDSLGQVLIALAPVLAQLATTLGQVLTENLQAVMPYFTQLLPVLTQLTAALLPVLIPLIRLLGDSLLVQTPLISALVRLMAAILVPVIKLLIPLVEALAKGLDWVADEADKVVPPVVKLGDEIAAALFKAKTWKEVGHWFAGIWHDIEGFVSKAVAWFKQLPGKVSAALRALPGILERAAKDAFHKFFFAVGYGIGLVIRETMAMPGQVASIVTGMWDWASKKFSEGVAEVVGFVKTLRGKVGAWFTSTKDTAVSTTSSLISKVTEFLSSLPGKAWDAIKPLPGKVKDAVSGAATWLYDAGRNVVQGLIDGLKSKWTSAVNAIKGLGHDILSGFNSAVGNSSPSKLFGVAGFNVVAGFVKGITDNASSATAAVARMLTFGGGTGLTVPSLSLAGTPASLVPVASSAPAQAVVNLHVSTLLDGKVIHRQLIPHAQQYKSRTGTTGLD